MGTAVAAGAPISSMATNAAENPHRTSAFIRRVIPGSRAVGAGYGGRRPALPGRRGHQLDLAALHAHLDAGRVAAQRLPPRHRGAVEGVEEVVGVQRIVVEE